MNGIIPDADGGADQHEIDLTALFTTTQITTDPDGVHRDAEGRVYDAIEVGGEVSFVLREPDRLAATVNPGTERAGRAVAAFADAAALPDTAAWHLPGLAWTTLGAFSAGLTDAELGAVARALLDAEVEAWATMPNAPKRRGGL